MDSRHESFKQGLLNHLIIAINTYIKSNIDILINDEHVQNDIVKICDQIYRFLGMPVDVYNTLSKHNLLSKDVVFFPTAPDAEANKILEDSDFKKLNEHLQVIITVLPSDSLAQRDFKQMIGDAFAEYHR